MECWYELREHIDRNNAFCQHKGRNIVVSEIPSFIRNNMLRLGQQLESGAITQITYDVGLTRLLNYLDRESWINMTMDISEEVSDGSLASQYRYQVAYGREAEAVQRFTGQQAVSSRASYTTTVLPPGTMIDGGGSVTARQNQLGKGLLKYLDGMAAKLQNLRTLFDILSDDFFLTNRKDIFSQFIPMSRPYFPWYAKMKGIYLKLGGYESYEHYKQQSRPGRPMLVYDGELMESLTNKNARGALYIAAPHYMDVGTTLLKGKFNVQHGRNPVQLDPPNSGRKARWRILADKFVRAMPSGDRVTREYLDRMPV